jgi:Phosphotransferase enzyme family
MSTVSPTTKDEELERCVELALTRAGHGGSPLAAIRRRAFPASTSYAAEIVTVELAGGETTEIFLKDYGSSRLPKDAAAEQRERELRVYEELLEPRELGTARFLGACRGGRVRLLLELVDGDMLRDLEYEFWPPAAAWLGRLHGRFNGRGARLRACDFLIRHDADFFVHAAERALRTLFAFSVDLGRRLGVVLDDYDAVLTLLAREPETLVHGSYRPQNVLVDRTSHPPRICPTDWELAAFGRCAFDLAFLCDGFRPPRLDELLEAYARDAEGSGAAPRDLGELQREIECFRLHKTVNSLGHVRQWPRPAQTAAKVVATAEQIAATLV